MADVSFIRRGGPDKEDKPEGFSVSNPFCHRFAFPIPVQDGVLGGPVSMQIIRAACGRETCANWCVEKECCSDNQKAKQ